MQTMFAAANLQIQTSKPHPWRMDPHGLLNPGKIDLTTGETAALKTSLGTSGRHAENDAGAPVRA